MGTIPPPPPAPPAKVDLRQMRVIAEAPSRRKVQLTYTKTLPRLKGASEAPSASASKEDAGSSFFMTSTDATLEARDEALQRAQAQVLEHEDLRADDLLATGSLDMRSAVNALKVALERPAIEQTAVNAHHLKPTANQAHRKRDKFEPASRGQLTGQLRAGARKMGTMTDDMGANLTELQHRVEAQATAPPLSPDAGDADGDACMSSMLSMLGAMHDMTLAPGAAPSQPSVA